MVWTGEKDADGSISPERAATKQKTAEVIMISVGERMPEFSKNTPSVSQSNISIALNQNRSRNHEDNSV
jgi:co-chaperonin GroES (HSP10)